MKLDSALERRDVERSGDDDAERGREIADIKRELTRSSLTSSSSSPVLPESSPYQPQVPRESCPQLSNTDSENCSSTAGGTCCLPSKGLAALACPQLMFTEGLLTSAQNCSLGTGWFPPPPPPPVNLFCLPFHPSYSDIFPPFMSVPAPPEHPGGLLSMQSLLAHYAMSAARLPPLLFPSNLAAQFPSTTTHSQLTSKLSEEAAMQPGTSDHGLLDRTSRRSWSDAEAAGSAPAAVERRRVSCDSTAATSSGGMMTVTSDCESNESPRVVSSTSDDSQPPAADVTGTSSQSLNPNTHRRRRRDETVLSRRVGGV